MTGFVVLLAAAGIPALIVATITLRGWVMSILWGWFIAPIFGLPAINVPQAIGISIVIAVMTHQHISNKEGETWQPFMTAILGPLLSLLAGWIVRFWL